MKRTKSEEPFFLHQHTGNSKILYTSLAKITLTIHAFVAGKLVLASYCLCVIFFTVIPCAAYPYPVVP
ncbi:hypothetical protein T03_12156, partial [Trichinella britovi]